MGDLSELPSKYVAMINRYAIDLRAMLAEVARVLKHGGGATFVMGNSCLKGVYIRTFGRFDCRRKTCRTEQGPMLGARSSLRQ